MTTIRVVCTDQVLTYENTPMIASGGLEENFVQFSFCNQWDGFEKTAVFWRSETEAYHNLLDVSNSCQLPPEVTADDGIIYLGVFGVDAVGRQRTSTVLTYRIEKGAITVDTQLSDPTPDIYNQLLVKYQEMKDIAAEVKAAEEAFEEAMTQKQTAHETAVAASLASFEDTVTQRQTAHEAAVDADQLAFQESMTQAQEEYEQHILEMIAAGLLPDDSVATEKIKDGAITAEKLAPGVMVDAYTKEETLTSETKTEYGLTENATPNDIFLKISKIVGVGYAESYPWKLLQIVDEVGSFSYVVPDGISELAAIVIGGGGAGGWHRSNSSSYKNCFATGGASGEVNVYTSNVSAGQTISGSVGAGGAAKTSIGSGSDTYGGDGDSSTFGAVTSLGGSGGKGKQGNYSYSSFEHISGGQSPSGGASEVGSVACVGGKNYLRYQTSTHPVYPRAFGQMDERACALLPGIRFCAAGGSSVDGKGEAGAEAAFGKSGGANTGTKATGYGNGGGGAAYNYDAASSVYKTPGGAGASGAVIIFGR